MSTAWLCPGQGEQRPGLLSDPPDELAAAVDRVCADAAGVLDEDPRTLDTADALTGTRATQLVLLLSSLACGRALAGRAGEPDYLAGHSVGAFAAAVLAGALDPADAIRLVELRGRLMEHEHPRGYGMGVLGGLPETRVRELIAQVSTEDEPVYPANVNADDQVAVSGALAGLERLYPAARSAGARTAKALAVHTPSHCPLMAGVAARLGSELDAVPIGRPRIPVAGNIGGRTLRRAEDVRRDLADSVAHPVRWADATEVLRERGATLFVQLTPGHSLSRLAARLPGVRAVSVDEAGIAGVAALSAR